MDQLKRLIYRNIREKNLMLKFITLEFYILDGLNKMLQMFNERMCVQPKERLAILHALPGGMWEIQCMILWVLGEREAYLLSGFKGIPICCTAGQYSHFPGCTPRGSKPYKFSQFILHIRVYGGCQATNRLMHGWYYQDTPSAVYYTPLDFPLLQYSKWPRVYPIPPHGPCISLYVHVSSVVHTTLVVCWQVGFNLAPRSLGISSKSRTSFSTFLSVAGVGSLLTFL